LLVKENKKFVKLKNAYALEVENCENLSKELNMCNDSISCLRDENASLNATIEELNVCKPSTSTIEHVTICTRCRDVNIEAIHDHLAITKEQNDHITKLNDKIVEHELENENFKFARSMLYNGRRPGIKDDIGFQQGSQSNIKLNAPKKLSNFVKGKAPMVQDREGYILYPKNYPEHKIRKIHARKPHIVSHHAYLYSNEASSSRHSTHIKMPKNKIENASNEHNISFKTFDASYVLTNKSGKVVAKYVGGKHKSPKTVIDPHLVNLIRENPRYTKMTPKEILGKFVSGHMMVKEARYVDDALNGPLPIYEPQLVALKATSSRETLPSKVAQVEAVGLNEDEMALIIKRFKTALKGCKEYPNKNETRGKCSCFKCGKTGHFIA
jgi:hypothetical protein